MGIVGPQTTAVSVRMAGLGGLFKVRSDLGQKFNSIFVGQKGPFGSICPFTGDPETTEIQANLI